MSMFLCRFILIAFCFQGIVFSSFSQNLQTPFERNNNSTTRYEDCISFYRQLEKKSKLVKVIEAGSTDVSYPLHTVLLSSNKQFTPAQCRKAGKAVLLINNGIHPGEPDGIDAAMLFARELVMDPAKQKLLDHVCIVIIPIYNVSGSLMRNSTTRVNQNGPDEYGFRGTAQNLDLNRDFIKVDSRITESFIHIFKEWDPDLFVETHTTDGADYPYLMTLISSQRHKLQVELGNFMYKKFHPAFLQNLRSAGLETSPYIEGDPQDGIRDFMDSPRYSSGYAATHHCMAYLTESHMLKPYSARVNAHRLCMHQFTVVLASQKDELLKARREAKSAARELKSMDLKWELDTNRVDKLMFSGYTMEMKQSPYTGASYRSYDRQNPYVKAVPYYNAGKAVLTVSKPVAYLIPAAYDEVIQRLKWNGVQMQRLEKDSLIKATFYKITDFKSPSQPYEGHYVHSGVQVEKLQKKRMYFKGDYIIYSDQEGIRFLMETIEPQAPDSYFAWNFFDGILQRKEYFSDYLFVEKIPEIFSDKPGLQEAFENKKRQDEQFAKNPQAQLEYIYSASRYAEPEYRIYPVGRIETSE